MRQAFRARTISTGMSVRCRTSEATLPRIRSPSRRWPCVDMAIRSQPSRSAMARMCSAGSPQARIVST